MESLSAITSLINFFKNLPAWILKKFGRKIVKIDDYKDETLEVDFDYASKSPQCIEETKNGAKFYWSEKYHIGYKKYFELDGDTRKYFQHRKQILWIKRQ